MTVGAGERLTPPSNDQHSVNIVNGPWSKRDDEITTGGGKGPPSGPTVVERKFAAKRRNEQVKLFSSGMNTLAAAAITTSTLLPAIKGLEAFISEFQGAWYLVGIGLHIAGQLALRFEMRSEE